MCGALGSTSVRKRGNANHSEGTRNVQHYIDFIRVWLQTSNKLWLYTWRTWRWITKNWATEPLPPRKCREIWTRRVQMARGAASRQWSSDAHGGLCKCLLKSQAAWGVSKRRALESGHGCREFIWVYLRFSPSIQNWKCYINQLSFSWKNEPLVRCWIHWGYKLNGAELGAIQNVRWCAEMAKGVTRRYTEN